MQLFVISFFFLNYCSFFLQRRTWRFCLLQMVFRGQGYFSYIVAISFIGGGNRRSTRGFELTTLVVIGTDCIGSCKSNYHTITTTTAPKMVYKKQELLTFREHLVYDGDHLLLLFSFLWQVFSCVCRVRSLSWVYVACVSGLFIFYFPFGFL